jgi:hypothetical protein
MGEENISGGIVTVYFSSRLNFIPGIFLNVFYTSNRAHLLVIISNMPIKLDTFIQNISATDSAPA